MEQREREVLVSGFFLVDMVLHGGAKSQRKETLVRRTFPLITKSGLETCLMKDQIMVSRQCVWCGNVFHSPVGDVEGARRCTEDGGTKIHRQTWKTTMVVASITMAWRAA